MKDPISNFLNLFTVNRYYQMDTHTLELEAAKYKIGDYVTAKGVSRHLIIKQLIEKDVANNSRFAIYISIAALIISVLALAK